MDEQKQKEGMSVEQIEKMGKKYRFQLIFLCYFILAAIFSFAFFGVAWSIYLAALGGILGIWIPEKTEKFGCSAFRFVKKQEKITQIILAAVGAVVAIFLAPLIYLFLGAMGGAEIHHAANRNGGSPQA